MSYTKAPWTQDGDASMGCVLVTSRTTQVIAEVDVSICCDEKEGLANARLIAAAPEMLEALKECRRFLREVMLREADKPIMGGPTQAVVLAAIHKAEGR